MGLNPSLEAASRSTNQESPNVFLNWKFRYLIHKSPPLVPTLNQINPVHASPSYL
jgi:hypothetical protein